MHGDGAADVVERIRKRVISQEQRLSDKRQFLVDLRRRFAAVPEVEGHIERAARIERADDAAAAVAEGQKQLFVEADVVAGDVEPGRTAFGAGIAKLAEDRAPPRLR